MGRIRVGETEVQRRLGVEEVLDVIRPARGVRGHELAKEAAPGIHQRGIVHRPGLRRILRLETRPDVIVGVTEVGRFLRLEEPLVLVRGVAGHQVHHDLDAARMGGPDQLDEVRIGAEALVHPVEVDDVVAAVRPPRHIHGVEPDGGHADGLDIVQAGQDAFEVAVTVPVAVLEGRRIDLVEHGVAQPGGLRRLLGPHAGHGKQAQDADGQYSFHYRCVSVRFTLSQK